MISNSLYSLYQQWHQIASSEQSAIQRKSWGELAVHADRKAKILEEIRQLEVQEKGPRVSNDRLTLIIHQIADLEQQNLELLGRERGQLEMQMDDLKRRRRILHQIRKSY